MRKQGRVENDLGSISPVLNQHPGLTRTVLHANPPDQLFGTDHANVVGQSSGTPKNRIVTSLTAMRLGVFLRQVLRVFVRAGRIPEP
jgi:hypothetical protein